MDLEERLATARAERRTGGTPREARPALPVEPGFAAASSTRHASPHQLSEPHLLRVGDEVRLLPGADLLLTGEPPGGVEELSVHVDEELALPSGRKHEGHPFLGKDVVGSDVEPRLAGRLLRLVPRGR